MRKKLFGIATVLSVLALSVVALTSCGSKKDKFTIYAWNEEFKGFFESYVSDEKVKRQKGEDSKVYHIDGLEVEWVITPSEKGQYQDALALALKNGDKMDMFLAEADYINKFADSNYTSDVTKIGVTNFSTIYNYTKTAASDSKGVVKGVSFQCCPSALIYNRVIANDVFGTDDPAVIQTKVSSWEKFDEAAALVKEKGYYMLACESDSYRVFSNNAATPWVDSNKKVTIPASVEQWMTQAETFIQKKYTVAADVWGSDKTSNLKKDETTGYAGKAFCTFGPGWYYNFCMGMATPGDWAVTEGPQAHFWGGTWIMLPAQSKHTESVAKIMNAFINDTKVCTNLVKNEGQFVNNQTVNAAIANDANYAGNTFLKGQNDTKLYLELAKNIKFENLTIYDQLCNETLQEKYREYLKGDVTKEVAIANFYNTLQTKYPALVIPTK